MAEESEEEVDPLPENLNNLLNDIPFYLPEDADEGTMEVVKRGANGRCCTCNKDLGKNTLIVIGVDGTRMVFCCGACLADMQITAWLATQYDDMVELIKFRGGMIDADGPPEGEESAGGT